ncbi:MAG: methyltransferase domain-containing protein [Planctomycetaceae bacterium]|nr:methyltransferase domain-containing protein [Planctomycetales bacterium]MCB9937367.1 methyltransferase domain-containing protein [Planctomycetaceae bacterium]
MATSSVRPCPLCKHRNDESPTSPLSRDPWVIKACENCGFVYLVNPPDVTELECELAWEKTSVDETARRRTATPIAAVFGAQVARFRRQVLARRKLKSLLQRLASPGPVLDVGCGWGHTLEENLPDGFTPWGIELSVNLAEQARQRFSRLGGQVFQGDAVTHLREQSPGFFHAVTLIAILEHVLDPVELLHEAGRVLSSQGVVVIKVPNFASVNRRIRGRRWCGLRFPDHVNYFTPDSLVRSAKKAGLHITRFGLFDRQPTSDNMWCVLSRTS